MLGAKSVCVGDDPAFFEWDFQVCWVAHGQAHVEENHSITKKTRTIFLAACCKISSVAQYLVVVAASMFQEVLQ